MLKSRFLPAVAGIGAMAVALAGCSGGGDGGGLAPDEPGEGNPTGQLTLAITDAPVDDATAVVVEFTGLELKPSGDVPPFDIDFDSPRQIDLLALQGGTSEALISSEDVPAGEYEWVRLKVNAELGVIDSFISFDDGSMHSLFVPSGAQTGLKLVSDFVVVVDGLASYTIDFDLRKSIVYPPGLGGDYILRPTLRLVDNAQAGSIEGSVAMSLIDDPSCSDGNAVYVFEGDVEPNDVHDGGGINPLTSALVDLDTGTGEFRYSVAFLPAGPYTVAFTCQAGDDDPETDDDIAFLDRQTVSVEAGQTSTVDFDGESTMPPAGPLTVRFDFEASDFGGGPPGASPISDIQGSFTVAYDTGDLTGAAVQSFELETVNSPGYEQWGDNFTAASVLLEVSPAGIRIGGLDPLDTVTGASNDFLMSFDFEAQDPVFGALGNLGFSYSVSDDTEVYQTQTGSVIAERLD